MPKNRNLLKNNLVICKKTVSNETVFLLKMVRAMGIEPTSQAWEARVLPLNDARINADRYLAIDSNIVKTSEKTCLFFYYFAECEKKTCFIECFAHNGAVVRV